MTSEANVQAEVRAMISHRGGYLWRNNSGVFMNPEGQPIRFGLGNDSKAVNKVMKSSDLIGILPRLITPRDVGHTIGQFLAIECKSSGFKYNGKDPHQWAQMNYITLVNRCGGIGHFISDPSDFERLMK